MNPDALFSADAPIPAHAVAALLATLLGAVQFALPKGTPLHRATGWIWVALMVGVALSSFWIHTFRLVGPFSPIHLLSILVLVSAWLVVSDARAGRVAAHRAVTVQLYAFALILTGAFTLLPGRIMHSVLSGGG